jgi:hypothetical protein
MKNEDEMEVIYKDFKEHVNMSPSNLEKWLGTKESKSVGWDSGDGESIGHKSGEEIVKILHTKKADLSPSEYKHMQKVVGYIKRHLAQRPDGDLSETNWNYSLKNWGHDYKNEN